MSFMKHRFARFAVAAGALLILAANRLDGLVDILYQAQANGCSSRLRREEHEKYAEGPESGSCPHWRRSLGMSSSVSLPDSTVTKNSGRSARSLSARIR